MMDLLAKDNHTIAEHTFKTSDKKHNLYVQEWGNKNGEPILFIHGGPGGGCSQGHKRIFDPTSHHIIFVDQRGSGLSTPYAETKTNTTQLLIEDFNLILEKLSLDKVSLFGRSWGSTLALYYAITHPEKIKKLIIGGVFLATKEEDDWLTQGGFRNFYPEIWDKYGTDPDSLIKFARLALPTIKLDDRYSEINEPDFKEDFFKIERFYAENNWFLPENYILDNSHKIKIPVYIIQGRYDMMTPPMQAYKLHKAIPGSKLQWTVAGHSGSDRGNFDASKAALAQL